MNKSLAVFLLLALIVLPSCRYLTGDDGVFRDRQGDYLEAPVEPTIRVPDNLDSYTLDQLYVVPENVLASREDYSANIPRPQPLDTNRPEGVVIRRYSGENWIVIAASPGQVWPRVRDFWAQAAIELEYENPVEGIMETGWLDSSTSGGNRDKYRLRIEPGLHAGSSDIFVLHINRPRNFVGTELVIWPEASESEDQEFEIMQQISQYLADRTDIYSSSSSSLLAGSLAGEKKANLLETETDDSILELRISLTRAWAQVGQALERADVSIVERDREASVFDVEFSGIEVEADSPGFFRRVFSRGDEEVVVELPFRITLEQTQSGINVLAEAQGDTEADKKLEAELLQLILSNLG
ncbi:MAG: outer membrane protein assembly factor BamC [Gammaproteobacteria bacterium]|nr:outer membrane protein assembly factor BamC [Gammaproteobacteria bacterium]